jgi:hypothetical protein
MQTEMSEVTQWSPSRCMHFWKKNYFYNLKQGNSKLNKSSNSKVKFTCRNDKGSHFSIYWTLWTYKYNNFSFSQEKCEKAV